MLEVKKARAAKAGSDPTTAQYLDRMQREGRPVTLRIDDWPPLVIKDARACRLLWELVDRIETIAAVREGLEQVEQGRTLPLEVTEVAAAEIDSAYEWIREQAPNAAQRWYAGLMTALNSLRQNPRRCARILAAEFEGLEIRQLVYGRRRGRYRILFTISGDTVEIVRVLHGARAAARR